MLRLDKLNSRKQLNTSVLLLVCVHLFGRNNILLIVTVMMLSFKIIFSPLCWFWLDMGIQSIF
jgi:hypothetical protein